ncbi:MAG: D-alanyl-D-alanine carboxypeptidase [Clostridia bacterium]|nr:D-alanyl-D-alanine carboxypeptidase [Clostridia bacterium]
MRAKRIFGILVAVLLAVLPIVTPLTVSAARSDRPLYGVPQEIEQKMNAEAYLLVSLGTDVDDDVLLFGKNWSDTALRSPAALVRLMVGVCAMEMIEEQGLSLDTDTGTYHSGCFDLIAGTGISVLELPVGATLTLKDLLTATMMQTAGDAAVTLAVTLAGSNAAFVARMNETAQKLGCTATSFSNVTGLEGGAQYTNCIDLYRIMRQAMEYPELKTMMGTVEYTVRWQGGKSMTIVNTNELIRPTTLNYCAECVAGRTGYTSESGRCVVSVAQNNGYEYMAVVLGCPDKNAQGVGGLQYDDSRALYKWAWEHLSYTTLVAKGEVIDRMPVGLAAETDSVTLVAADDVAIVLPAGFDHKTVIREVTRVDGVDAPIERGKVYGKLTLKINLDQVIGEVDLVASEGIQRSALLYAWRQVTDFLATPWFYIAIGVVLLLLFGYIVLNLYYNRKRRKNNQRRVRQYK